MLSLKGFVQKFISFDNLFELFPKIGGAFFFRIIDFLATYSFTLSVTNLYGAENMGIFSLCQTVLMLACMFGRMGQDTLFSRDISRLKGKIDDKLISRVYLRSVTLLLPIGILLNIIFYLISPFIANKILGKPLLTSFLQVISFWIIPTIFMFVNSESLRGLGRTNFALLLRTGMPFGFSVIFIFFQLQSSFIPVYAFCLGIALSAGFGFYLLRYFIRGREGLENKENLFSLIKRRIPMFFISSIFLIMNWLNIFMLGIFRSNKEVGIFHVLFDKNCHNSQPTTICY